MALADPQSVTISGVAIPLPRTSSGLSTGEFTSSDGLTKLKVSHAYGKRNRRTYRLEVSKTAPDPLISAQSVVYSMSVYIVLDSPKTGFTVAEQVAIVAGFTTFLTASSNAKVTQLAGGEN